MTGVGVATAPPAGWRLWLAGARPRTLGAAVAPVLVGTASTVPIADHVIWWRAVAALVVALALQVGTNYVNDYSDGVRGTDHARIGPMRLVASGLVSPAAVRAAALLCFATAGSMGLALSLAVEPWLLAFGAVCLLAGPLYTGGPRPYGYAGFGEPAVLCFFGLAATAGSAYVQLERVPAEAWWGSIAVGLLACAILVANNVRDVESDAVAGKRTLAVRLGGSRARLLFLLLVAGSFGAVVGLGTLRPLALVALAAVPLAVQPVRAVLTRRDAGSLVSALVATARLDLVVSVLLAVGLCLS